MVAPIPVFRVAVVRIPAPGMANSVDVNLLSREFQPLPVDLCADITRVDSMNSIDEGLACVSFG
jgi:hypothetical protein